MQPGVECFAPGMTFVLRADRRVTGEYDGRELMWGLRAGYARAAPFLPGLPISPALYDELVAAITGLARLTLAQGEQPPHGGRWGVARLRAVRYDPVASEHPR